MAAEQQSYEDDPIIADLGITLDRRPVIPPVDIVFGYFQNDGADFRLYHKDWGMYMQASAARIKQKSPAGNRSRLVLLADGNYEQEVVIENLVEEEGGTTTKALYTTYTMAKTTPWHE